MAHSTRRRTLISVVVAVSLLPAACGSASVTPSPTTSPVATLAPAAPSYALPSPPQAPGSALPTADTTGFAFAADDIAAYYETQGYACVAPQPSTSAEGFTFRTCEMVDDARRTRVIGLVTAADGGLANGFARVTGNDTETILEPIDALDTLAGFLGALLGEQQGTALLPWLASHLGDAYAETTSGPLKVATYTESEEDHATLYVEVANQAYLDAPPVESP